MESKKLSKILFSFYFLALIWIILFKMQMPFSQFGIRRSINLIPFAESVVVDGKIYVKEIVDNILIFVPFGVFACMIGREKNWLQRLAPVFFTSLAVEVLQYILGIGATDITDLLGNTAGGLLGMGVFAVFRKLCREKVYLILNVVLLVGAVGAGVLLGMLVLVNAS